MKKVLVSSSRGEKVLQRSSRNFETAILTSKLMSLKVRINRL